jgi:hypothetical protein
VGRSPCRIGADFTPFAQQVKQANPTCSSSPGQLNVGDAAGARPAGVFGAQQDHD